MKPCDHWRESLAELALGEPAGPELTEHLAKCASCSAALAKMQSLTGEIDRGIRQLTLAEPSTDGAARTLAEVGARVEQIRWWRPPGRTVAAACAGVVLLAASLGLLRRIRTQQVETKKELSAAVGISSWKSPTRELLRSPYDTLLERTPRLGEYFYKLDSGSPKMKNSAPRAKEKQNP
jgi:hypothetical protein